MAYRFYGLDDWMVINDSPSLNNENLSVSFWFRPHGQSTSHQYFLYKVTMKNGTDEEYASGIHYNTANNIGFSVKTGGHCTQSGIGWNHNYSSGNTYDSLWHHMVITYDGNLSRVYINGNLLSQVSLAAGDIDNCPGGVLLLGVKWGMTNFLNADLDDIRIYDRALIPSEVMSLYTELPCPGSSISGNVYYDNSPQNSPLSCLKVYLKTPAGQKVDSAMTDQGGYFQFCNVANGNYKISVKSSKAWGGVNSADALIAVKHFAQMITLSGVKFKAGDVNSSSYINAMDALIISRKFTGSVSAFAIGDWVFEEPQLAVTSSPLHIALNIKGLCTGDVSASYIPSLITAANAGIDQLNVPGNTAVLNANQPAAEETGTWMVLSGTGGTFSDIHSPQASFTGQAGKSYYLIGSITNQCNYYSNDNVVVSFGQ